MSRKSSDQTPSQTAGPFFAYGLVPDQYGYRELTSLAGSSLVQPGLAGSDVPGERIAIEGRVLDGEGTPIRDALVEIWQADSEGRYAHPADSRARNSDFTGFGRCGTGTDAQGRFRFDTIRPGAVSDGKAPHVTLIVTMRGLLNHLYTRAYFSDLAQVNATDPVLSSIPEDRRETLVAELTETPAGPVYRFDIHMQGDRETVFFEL